MSMIDSSIIANKTVQQLNKHKAKNIINLNLLDIVFIYHQNKIQNLFIWYEI